MSEKTRCVLGPNGKFRNATMIRRYGNLYNNCKLNDQHVVEIRRRYAAGNVIQADLADEYGVSRVAISYVVNRKHYGIVD